MKPWWLHHDPNLTSAIITYENIPFDFLEDMKNSDNPIFPPLALSVTDFLDKHIPSLPEASTVSLFWSHEKPHQAPSHPSSCSSAPISETD